MSVKTYTQAGLVERYAGLVVAEEHNNWSGDSDFYAIVWLPDEQRCVRVLYDTTRCGGSGSAEIDASEEIKRLAYNWLLRRWYDKIAPRLSPEPSMFVRIVGPHKTRTGQTVRAGDHAYVRKIGRSEYGHWLLVERLDTGETLIVPRHKTEIVNPANYGLAPDTLAEFYYHELL